jgi:hypothetical protein
MGWLDRTGYLRIMAGRMRPSGSSRGPGSSPTGSSPPGPVLDGGRPPAAEERSASWFRGGGSHESRHGDDPPASPITATTDRVESSGDWPRARPLVVAIDLASNSSPRSPEILDGWTPPPQELRRVR